MSHTCERCGRTEDSVRLAAAAPELLEAAIAVSDENLALSTPALVALDAAIAKAGGARD